MATTQKGATTAQGWYLFLFLLGFTLGPAGLYGLGWPVALIGFGMLAASFAGFRSIKDPPAPLAETREAPAVGTHAVKSY
jgi:hypothetical protein